MKPLHTRNKTKYLRVRIPTKTYLKKFIIHQEGDMLVIDNSSAFKSYVFAMLDRNATRDSHRPKNLSEMGHTDTLEMLVSSRTWHQIGHSISTEKAMYINKFVAREFSHYLCLTVINQTIRNGLSIEQALELFCAAYGLELDEDITMDNLLKIWQRKLHEIEPHSTAKKDPLIIPVDAIQLPLFST